MKGVADTSWLYAVFDERDPHHAEARHQLGAAESVHVPPAILAETLDLIEYRAGKATAVAALEDLARAPPVRLEREHDVDSVNEIWRAHAVLTYADASAVSAARRLGLGLYTFDRRQRRALNVAPP